MSAGNRLPSSVFILLAYPRNPDSSCRGKGFMVENDFTKRNNSNYKQKKVNKLFVFANQIFHLPAHSEAWRNVLPKRSKRLLKRK